VQVAHSPSPLQITTYPAPEPRDIVWSNMAPSTGSIRLRDVFVLLTMGLLLFFWFFPITALASLLSYKEIKKAMPWLGRLIDSNDQVGRGILLVLMSEWVLKFVAVIIG
jgi:hypothetical protein